MFRVLVDPYQELVFSIICWESMSSCMTQGNSVASPLEKVFKIAGSDVETGSSNYDAFGHYDSTQNTFPAFVDSESPN